MQQQLDSISQGKRKHPAFFAFGVGGAGGGRELLWLFVESCAKATRSV